MTKVVFSPFSKPDVAPGRKPGPQYLRLATTSLGNTIDVETFELQPLSKKPKSRYILQSARSRALTETAKYIVIAMIVAAVALILQGFVDPEGALTRSIVPQSLQNAATRLKPMGAVANDARSAVEMNNADSPIAKTSNRLRDLLHLHRSADSADKPVPKAVVVHHDPDADGSLSTEVHGDAEDVVKAHTEAKRWEELSKGEQKKWKDKLINAGMWAVEEGETVLKGIFFSEAAGLVGRVAQEVIG